MRDTESVPALVVRKLTTHLGPNVARIAVKTFSQKSLGKNPEELTADDLPRLLEAIRPMLGIMIGKDAAQVVLDDIAAHG